MRYIVSYAKWNVDEEAHMLWESFETEEEAVQFANTECKYGGYTIVHGNIVAFEK